MKKLLQSLFLLMLFVASQALAQVAQERTVTGTVTAKEDGLPLPGVSVLVKGTQVGTQTDVNGKFSIKVPASRNQLEFRFVGFTTHTLTLTSANNVSVVLNSDSKELGEVIVTGYVAQTKKEFTGASARVSGGAIADRPVQSFGQGLTGQAAGVSIVQPNGLLNNAPVIRVRGISSISLSSFPLVVVDGIPISTSNVSANSSTNNPLGDINPSDIESIDILKDAASTAVYGSRAAAGVLVITTKKGKQGQSKVTYEGWAGVTNAMRLPHLLDAQQYIDHKNMAVANAIPLNANAVPASQRDASGKSFFPNYNADGSMVNTNWLNEVYRTAISQNHNISISGASAKTSYYVSAGISDQDGFLKNNSFGRRAGRVNLTHAANDWLKLSVNMNYTNSMNKAPNSGSAPGDAFNSSGLGRIAFALSPNLAVRKADGTYNIANSTVGNGNNLVPTTWAHPTVIADLDKNSSETSRLIANLGADVKLYKGLTFRTAYSWDRGNTENIQFWNPLQGDGYSYPGLASNRADRRENWNLINTLQYNATFGGNHNLTLALVSDIQKSRTQTWGATRQGVADPFFNQFQGTYTTNVAGGNSIGQTSYTAYIATLNYNYAGKYFISGNFRRDGNSSLALANRYGNFGGASLGWTISEEDFFKNSGLEDKVSSLKFRASWGRVGNGGIPNYSSYTTYSSGLYGAVPIWLFNTAGNQEIKWETSQQTNFGLDMGFLNDRI
ncbi:MAG TPA: SusC/RagA family TonB-linked outer membrane protein, partial [Daejeonella sp.]|nr:SusC/RagA family TonB-linked outer membrane protein [Daejeonella sp.]